MGEYPLESPRTKVKVRLPVRPGAARDDFRNLLVFCVRPQCQNVGMVRHRAIIT